MMTYDILKIIFAQRIYRDKMINELYTYPIICNMTELFEEIIINRKCK